MRIMAERPTKPQPKSKSVVCGLTLRAAVNAKCKECIFDPADGCGTWRQQVAACTSLGCPLFPLRPLPDRRDRRSQDAKAANLPAPQVARPGREPSAELAGATP
jgi:hypothetical protein